MNVRLNAAKGFAERGDAIAAPILLKLWRDQNSSLGRQANFALANLMGEKLDRVIFDGAMQPRRVEWRNAEAFAHAEAWIASHPAN